MIGVLYVILCFLSNWVYTYFFAVTTIAFEFNNTVDFCIKSVISTTANVFTWIDFRTALTVKNRSTRYELTVCTFSTKTFGLRVTTVLCTTYTFFRREEL